MKRNIIKLLFLVFPIAFIVPAYSQELLTDVLQRGYISQWLICGPFPSDLDRGIKNAIRSNEAPLGTRDFWASKGGISQILPQSGETTQVDGVNYTWLPFTVKSPRLDFQTLQPPDECIYYLSAYVQVPEDQIIYINLQTPLGVRLWISKTKIRDVKALPIEHLGIDRALVRLRKGLNLFILEIPFLSIQSISEIVKIPIDIIPTRLWSQKEPNIGITGYEINFHIQPVQSAGALYYVPLLEPSRKFTGTVFDPKQVFYLTLYNPTPQQVFPVDINGWLMPQNYSLSNQKINLQPQEEIRLPLEIPNKGQKSNEKTNVRILITAPSEKGDSKTSEFTTQVTFTEPEPLSKTYLITGMWGSGENKQNETFKYLQQKTEAIKTQIWNAYENTEYGTDIGSGNIWLNVLQKNPEMLIPMREAMRRGKSSAQNIYSPIDERLLSMESILMNILIGTQLKESILKEFNKSFVAWDYPYLSPQTSQILHKCSFNGVVTNISPQTLFPLAFLRDPSGNSVLTRTLKTPPPFRNFREVKKWAFISHAEVESIIPEIDVLVLENTPPHYNINLLPDLKNEIPPFYFHGNGSSEFLEEIHNYLNSQGKIETIPNVFHPIYSQENLKDILSNTLLKTCLYQLEESLQLAQISATVAGVLGMTYPGKLIARLWTLLLQTADPDVINSKLTENEINSLISQLCIANCDAEKIIQRSMKHNAENVNTLTYVTDNKPNSQAIIVFNPNATTKTSPVFADISIPNLQFILVSSEGKPIPHQYHTLKSETSSIVKYQIEFVAEEVPSYGVKIFYLIPDRNISLPVKTTDNFIENEYILVRININTGNISQIIDKKSGKDVIPQGSNFDEIGLADINNGGFITLSDSVSKHETFKSDLLQQITIRYENKKGTLTKEYRLYQKVNQIYCYHRFTPAPELMGKNLVSSFPIAHQGTVSIYGTQSFAFTTLPPNYNSNTQENSPLLFAHHFYAQGPGDYIKNESDLCIPLTNVTFIKPEENAISTLQNLIKKTLWSRGIPSNDIPVQQWKNIKSKSHLYIWTGTQKSYEELQQLITETNPTLNNEIIRRSDIGTLFLVQVSEGDSFYNILGFIANTPEKLGFIIDNFLNTLNQRGEVLIPSAVTNIKGTDIPQLGFALMFQGTKLISQNSDKCFSLYHGKIEAHKQCPNVNSIPLHYRIYPFSGHWLQTDIIKKSNEKPMLSTTTGFHGGTWANNTSFLSMDNPSIEISSIKPIGTGIPLTQSSTQNPTDMFIVRLNSTSQQKQGSILESIFTISRLQSLTPLESSENPSINMEGQTLDFNPWEIRTFAVSLKKVAVPNRVPFDMEDIYYYDGNNLVFPLQIASESPILKISPIYTSSSTNIQLTICNTNANETIQGTVFFESSEDCILKTSQIPYELPPLTMIQHTIPYEQAEKENSSPIVNAWTEINGKTIRSFLSHEKFPANVQYEKDTSQIKIIIENPYPVSLYGNITWISLQYSQILNKIEFNKYMKPESTDIYIKPHETNTYTFLPHDSTLSASPIARIQINNKIMFLPLQ